MIARTPPYGLLEDDPGDGLHGTPWTNAWLQGFLNLLDARWSIKYINATGTQTVIDPEEADVVYLLNETDLAIRSIKAPSSPAKPGKPLFVIAAAAGNVYLHHNDTTGTTAADRLWNFIQSGDTPLTGTLGCAIYLYTGIAWRLIAHDQGGPIVFSPSLIGTGGSSGQVYTLQQGLYTVSDCNVHVQGQLTLSTLGTITSGAAIAGIPFTPRPTYYGAGTIGWYSGLAAAANVVHIGCYVMPLTAALILTATSNASSQTGVSLVTQAHLTDSFDVIFSAEFLTY